MMWVGRDAHVLVLVEPCGEVEQFEICGEVAGVGGANDTVPQYFGCDQVGGASGEFAGVIDEVTADGDADSIGVFLLWSIVNNNTGIGNGPVRGDVLDIPVVQEENSVGARCASLIVSLGQGA